MPSDYVGRVYIIYKRPYTVRIVNISRIARS